MTDEKVAAGGVEVLNKTLLTDQQAAAEMGWSRQKIQRLRLTGKLPYFPGRPPLIESADLERLKVRREPAKTGGTHRVSSSATAGKEAAEQRARQAWLRSRYGTNHGR